ncbi:hypothetical protein BsWGS_12742 [Bradybaena similaris]
MEFIKAFADAKKMGMSKEEFLPIWDTEAKMKLKAEEAKVLQLQQNSASVNTNHHHRDLKLEAQLTQQIEKLSNEVSHLSKRVDIMENSFSNNFEQQKWQIQQQIEEYRQHFTYLSDRLEIWMSSLKVSVAEVINAEFARASGSQKHEVKSNERSLGSSFQTAGGDTPDKLVYSEILQGGASSQKQPIVGQKGGTSTNGHRGLDLQDTLVWDRDDHQWELNQPDVTEAGAAENSKQACFTGTGKFADAISSMMTQDMIVKGQNSGHVNGKAIPSLLSESNGLYGYQEVSKNDRKRNQNTIKKDTSITYIPPHGAEFCVPSFKATQSKSQDFFTESFYTRPKACKVRLRLWFNKGGRLGVHLLVSEGAIDEHHQWPMIFEGEGKIFNQGSQTYTRLWVIEPQPCSKPQNNQEITLGASVCLDTSRDPCDDVTCDLLMRKRYVSDGDRLLFLWSVRAVENK